MILYYNEIRHFLTDANNDMIANTLQERIFNHYGHNPDESEVKSWSNSFRAFGKVINKDELSNCYIAVDYQLLF